MEMSDMLQVGAIVSTHGLRGEVKVFPTTDDAARFKKLKQVIMDTDREMLTLEIEGVKFFKKFVIVKFKGIDDINDIEKYKGKNLYVLRENAVKLEKDEYFITDLIGMKVIDETQQIEGTLTDVIETGANDVYVITMENEKELLLPAIKQCILDVDTEKKLMHVHILKGLLD